MRKFTSILVGLALTANAFAGGYIGDYAPGDTVDCNFGTVRPSTGASFTLAGTPAISVYKDNGTTESTSGVTLTADFDARTGLNHVRITTASDGTFYSSGAYFEAVITTGTVDSVSVVGQPVCAFSLNRVSALRPTTAGRTLDVSAGGEAGLDWANVGSPTTSLNLSGTTISAAQQVDVRQWYGSDLLTGTGPLPGLGVIDRGTAQAAAAGNIQLRSAAAFADNEVNGATALVYSATTGAGQSRPVSAYTGSNDTAAVATNWTTTPTGTIRYELFGTSAASGSGGSLTAADVWGYGGGRTVSAATNITSTGGTIPITSSRVDASVGAYQTGLTPLQPTVAGRTLDVSAGGEAGLDWANVGSPTTSLNLSGTTISTTQGVASVSGAVTVGTNNDKTGYALSAAALNAIRDITVEDQAGGGNISLACALAAVLAYVGGDVATTGQNSTYEEPSGVETRISGTTTSAGNRTATITCPTLP